MATPLLKIQISTEKVRLPSKLWALKIALLKNSIFLRQKGFCSQFCLFAWTIKHSDRQSTTLRLSVRDKFRTAIFVPSETWTTSAYIVLLVQLVSDSFSRPTSFMAVMLDKCISGSLFIDLVMVFWSLAAFTVKVPSFPLTRSISLYFRNYPFLIYLYIICRGNAGSTWPSQFQSLLFPSHVLLLQEVKALARYSVETHLLFSSPPTSYATILCLCRYHNLASLSVCKIFI